MGVIRIIDDVSTFLRIIIWILMTSALFCVNHQYTRISSIFDFLGLIWKEIHVFFIIKWLFLYISIVRKCFHWFEAIIFIKNPILKIDFCKFFTGSLKKWGWSAKTTPPWNFAFLTKFCLIVIKLDSQTVRPLSHVVFLLFNPIPTKGG